MVIELAQKGYRYDSIYRFCKEESNRRWHVSINPQRDYAVTAINMAAKALLQQGLEIQDTLDPAESTRLYAQKIILEQIKSQSDSLPALR